MAGIDPTVGQLRAFVAVAEELHFGRAASRLHMTQPPLSRTISALERGLGLTLFARTSRSVELTPAGEAFLPEARRVLVQLRRACEAAVEAGNGGGRTWRLGYAESAGFRVLPLLLTSYRRTFPSNAIELHELHTRQQLTGLRERTLDIGLMRFVSAEIDDLEVHYAYDDQVVVALAEGHPLREDPIEPASLADESFVVYDMRLGGGIFGALLNVAASEGFTPRVVNRAASTAMLMTLVAAGEGIALVAEPVSMVPRPGVRFARLASPLASAQMVCAWRSGEDNTAFRAILDMAREFGNLRDHAANAHGRPIQLHAGPNA